MDDFTRLTAERKAQEDMNKLIPIRKPHAHDVLCGRGPHITNFSGNVYLRALVGCFSKDFVTSTRRAEKSLIAKHILSQIKERDPPGRFLRKKKKDSKIWYEIDDQGQRSALYKIGQALRDNARGSNEGEAGDNMDGNNESLLSLGDSHGSSDDNFFWTRLTAERKAQEDMNKLIPIRKPHAHDVLCGRGHHITNFSGNVYLRALVGCFITKDFVTSTTRAEKSLIAKHILSQIKERDPPGRFLRKKKKDSKIWYEIDDQGQRSALYKIGQALRDNARGSNEGEAGDNMDGNNESLLSLATVSVVSDFHVAQQDECRTQNKATRISSTKNSPTLSAKSLKLDVTTHTDITSSSDPDDKGEFPVANKNSPLDVSLESLEQETTEVMLEESISHGNLINDELAILESIALRPLSPISLGNSGVSIEAPGAVEGSHDSLPPLSIHTFNMEDFGLTSFPCSSRTSLDSSMSVSNKFFECL